MSADSPQAVQRAPVRRFLVEIHDGPNTQWRTDEATQIKGLTTLLGQFAKCQTEGMIPAILIIRDEAQ